MIDIPTWTKRWVQIRQLDDVEVEGEEDKKLFSRLKKNVRNGLKEIEDFKGFFPVQQEVIPYILDGMNRDVNSYYSSDICISVPTGEGKTLCYVIPIANYLYDRTYPYLSVLVVVPTRELANQVKSVFATFTKINKGKFPIKIVTLTGQQPFYSEVRQLGGVQPDVVISTPGRLCEHYNQLVISQDHQGLPEIFRNIHFVVVDEVDKLLSQPYNNWEIIINHISRCATFQENNGELGLARKTPVQIFLSATISNSPYKISQLNLTRPIYFISSATGESSVPFRMCQKYIKVFDKRFKPESLLCLIYQLSLNKKQRKSISKLLPEQSRPEIKEVPKTYKTYFKAVVFCSSKETTSNLTKYLQTELGKANRDDVQIVVPSSATGEKTTIPLLPSDHPAVGGGGDSQGGLQRIQVEEFSSLLLQRERNMLMRRFKNNEFNILVCSDILARGIDISDVDIVINYDVPANIKTYIHRAGRTARAGKIGYTYTLVETSQTGHFNRLINSKRKSVRKQTMFVKINRHKRDRSFE